MKLLISCSTLIATLALILASCDRSGEEKGNLQKYETELVSPEISHSYITSFAEDKWGHVWIGTSHGLNKSTEYYYHHYLASADSLTLDDNHISSLLCDSKKRFWVATLNNHVSLLNENGKFRRIPIGYNNIGRTQLLESPGGQILLNAENGVLIYDEQADKMQLLIDTPNKNIGCFALGNDSLLIAYESKLEIYSINPFKMIKTIPLNDRFRSASLRNQQELWLSSRGVLKVFNLQTNNIAPAPLALDDYISRKQFTVFQVLEYDSVTIILNTKEGGVVRFNYRDQSLSTSEDGDYPYNIGKYNVSCLFIDSHHNLWIGSDGGGYKVVNNEKGFFHPLDENGFFNDMQVTRLANDSTRQALWVVAFGRELYYYDLSAKTAKLVWKTNENDARGIQDVAVCRNGDLWFTTGSQIIAASYNNKVFRIERTYATDMPEEIVVGHDGFPWVLARGGKVMRLSQTSNSFEQIYQYPNQRRGKSLIIRLRNGNILYSGMDSHLVEISPKELQPNTILEDRDIIKECGSGHFIPEVIKEDKNGNIWIGTQSDGVFIFNRQNRQIIPIKGINCEEISSIEFDKGEHVWIGTQYGLYEYETAGNFLNDFFKHDGLTSNSFSEGASVCLPDGMLVFGGLQGVTAFKPTPNKTRRNLKIVFEDLTVNNRLVIPGHGQPVDKPLSEKPEIELDYDQNNFSISYAVLNHQNKATTHYHYMLKGYDKDWTDAGGHQEAFYSNIPSGSYTFCVRIEDHSKKGEYFSESIKLTINPAPWATWWAYCLYLLLAFLIGSHYYQVHRRSVMERERVRKAEEEKEQEQRINEINKRYFANVAHQLRTPLTMISAPIRQLVGDKELKGQRHQLLKIVNHSIGRMLRLVNQLMDFNKLETDALSLRVKLVDIAPLLLRTLEIYKMNAEEKGIALLTDGLNGNCFTYVDTDKLVNIVDNLLSNAIKFTPQGGQISLCIYRITHEEAAKEFKMMPQDTDSHYIMIKVSDTGPGIPENELNRIFERYYQVDANQKGYFNWGTGIGLYYSLRLAEMHHGHIVAENNQGHSGATFKFILPSSMESYSEEERGGEDADTVAIQDSTMDFQKEERIEDASGMNKPRVLIVDDDIDISFFLRTLLSDYYRVTCCYDVESAKEQLHEQMPDIVVSDVVMTGDSGIDLCRYIKTELQFSHIPVILLTAKGNLEDQLEGIGAGADAYVAKPFNTAYLLQLVETTLRNRERIRKSLTEESLSVTRNTDGLTRQDRVFLDELYKIMDRELSNDEFNVSAIVEEMHLSHSKFIYKVKGLTGLTPSDFFKTYKLNKAAALLRKGEYNVSEVAYMTGFSTLAHFSKVFKKKFGVSPSQYVNPSAPSSTERTG